MDEMPGGNETASTRTDYCHFKHNAIIANGLGQGMVVVVVV